MVPKTSSLSSSLLVHLVSPKNPVILIQHTMVFPLMYSNMTNSFTYLPHCVSRFDLKSGNQLLLHIYNQADNIVCVWWPHPLQLPTPFRLPLIGDIKDKSKRDLDFVKNFLFQIINKNLINVYYSIKILFQVQDHTRQIMIYITLPRGRVYCCCFFLRGKGILYSLRNFLYQEVLFD